MEQAHGEMLMGTFRNVRSMLLFMGIAVFCSPWCHAHWLDVQNVKVRQEPTELGGPKIIIEYDLDDPNITPAHPAYVFLRSSVDFGETWQLVSAGYLQGNGFDIVEKPGHKEVIWWGAPPPPPPPPRTDRRRRPGPDGVSHPRYRDGPRAGRQVRHEEPARRRTRRGQTA